MSAYSASPVPSTSKQRLYEPGLAEIQSHFSEILSPLPPLPDALALRIATHKSANPKKLSNHNGKTSFYGRRILRMHLSIFFNLAQLRLHDTQHTRRLAIDILDTNELGRTVGKNLGLQNVMRWRSVTDSDGNETGLYRLRGETLQAFIAGIWGFHGANASFRFINSRILPQLSLPPAFAGVAAQIAQSDADLTLPGNSLIPLGSSPSFLPDQSVVHPVNQQIPNEQDLSIPDYAQPRMRQAMAGGR